MDQKMSYYVQQIYLLHKIITSIATNLHKVVVFLILLTKKTVHILNKNILKPLNMCTV